MSNQENFDVAYDYTVRFYPRYFTWVQFHINSENSRQHGGGSESFANRLTGPLGMGPEYKVVVAINDDTIYAEAFLDIQKEPVILTVPKYPNKYSVLQLDVYGTIFPTVFSSAPPSGGGVFAFTAPDYSGKLPKGVTQVPMPYTFSTIAIRIDKHSSSGESFLEAANKFRSSLRMKAFDKAFKEARAAVDRDSRPLAAIISGAQAAHAAIINRWQSHRGPTNWVHFNNIGDWGTNYLDRAALTEYIQVGNNREAAYYANAFVDDSGLPLDGSSFGYTITFQKDHMPEYQRFWSMTAYTPEYVELVPNVLNKYVVASYTEGLVTAEDGSVTIYVQADPPEQGILPNWLPVPKGPFSLLFRVYGPEGSALEGTYVAPKIHRGVPLP